MSRACVWFVLFSLVAASPDIDCPSPGSDTCGKQLSTPEADQLAPDGTFDDVFMLQLSSGMQAQESQVVNNGADVGLNLSGALSQLDAMLSEERAQGEVRLADRMGARAPYVRSTETQTAYFGEAKCPCIGIDNINGNVSIPVNGKHVQYPADLGASCEAWDNENHPLCTSETGEVPDWCGQEWCFVDPCNCLIAEGPVPRVSSYFPDAKYQGKGIFFSYNTCGGVDTYTGDKEATFCVNQKTWKDCESLGRCEWTLSETCVGTEVQGSGCGVTAQEARDESIWGSDDCTCVGISGKEGTTAVEIDSMAVGYPSDVGSTCKAWDDDVHPDCAGTDPKPPWCGRKWCYIDPCKCTISTPPKVISYLPGATFQGKPLYYSYATCGAVDIYTASGKHPNACVNQMSRSSCKAQGSKCTWTSPKRFGWEGCIGTNLATLCSAENKLAYSGCGQSSLSVALMLVLSFVLAPST